MRNGTDLRRLPLVLFAIDHSVPVGLVNVVLVLISRVLVAAFPVQLGRRGGQKKGKKEKKKKQKMQKREEEKAKQQQKKEMQYKKWQKKNAEG